MKRMVILKEHDSDISASNRLMCSYMKYHSQEERSIEFFSEIILNYLKLTKILFFKHFLVDGDFDQSNLHQNTTGA